LFHVIFTDLTHTPKKWRNCETGGDNAAETKQLEMAVETLTIVKAITRVVMKEMSGCISLRRSRSMPVIVTNYLLPKLTGGLSRFVFFIFQQDGVPPTYAANHSRTLPSRQGL